MKVIDKINEANAKGGVVFSLEFCPGSTEYATKLLFEKISRMVAHDPCFCAVSLHRRVSNADRTIHDANKIQSELGVETMMYVTCNRMPLWKIDEALDTIKSNGIQNVLAIGDPPINKVQDGFSCAIDLVEHIRAKYGDSFGITVTSDPEAYTDVIQSNGEATVEGRQNNFTYLKKKVDAGADLIIAPLFYDINIFIKFVDDCRDFGIICPIIPGIMPISNYVSFKYITERSKTKIPSEIIATMEPIKDDLEAIRKYGIHLGTEICKIILARGFKALHFYTLGFEQSTMGILKNLGLIGKAKIRPMPRRHLNDAPPKSRAKHGRLSSVMGKSRRRSHRTSTDYQLPPPKQSGKQGIPGVEEDNSVMKLPPSRSLKREVVTNLPASELPWLMLANVPFSGATRSFFSLHDGKIYDMELPETEGKRCIGSSDGWFITIDSKLEIGILNPFSKVRIRLPPKPTFKYQDHVGWRSTKQYRRDEYISKAFVSNPLSDDCIALAINYFRGNLAFCRPGSSTAWTTIASRGLNPFDDAIFYQGRFYAISGDVKLVVCDLGPVPKVIEILSGPTQLCRWAKYLVNAGDTLFMVARNRTVRGSFGPYCTTQFKVYILLPNSDGGVKWRLVKNLQCLALFVGRNSSICLRVDDYPECKSNCIYFTDDFPDADRISNDGAGADMGVYNYGDGTIQPLYPGDSRSRCWPPIWVKPN